MAIVIGDFVTSCEAGHWQLVDIKPKTATEEYCLGTVKWKKGDVIGQWAILKKAFTPKMKPRIEFAYVDASWLKPIAADVLADIREYFAQHPDYKSKFETAAVCLRPMIVNCWMNLSQQEAAALQTIVDALPVRFTMDEFWERATSFRKNVAVPPATHLMNFMTYPWDMDGNADLIYSGCEIKAAM